MRKKSVVRSVDILFLISKSRDGLSLNDIVQETGIPKTTVYEILLMLLETEMLQIVEDKTKKYKIGVKAFVIGNSYIKDMDLINESKKIVNDLCLEIDQTIFIANLEDNQIIYLYKREPDNVPIYTANIANREDVYCTSLGKAILAFLPTHRQNEIIESIRFKQRTPMTITNKKDLWSELGKTKKRGYSIDDREFTDFVFCIGAPIFDYKGRCIAAISCAGLHLPERDIEFESKKIMEAAYEISKRMGYIKKNN